VVPLGSMRRWMLGIAGLFALACGDVGLCENSSHVEIASPDGHNSAWVFVRTCRAITTNAVHVAILPSGSAPPDDAGNAFIVEGGGSVSVKWLGDRELLVSHEPKGQIVLQEPLVDGISIAYQLE